MAPCLEQTVYLVWQCVPQAGFWRLVGVFDTPERAREACVGPGAFIAPTKVNYVQQQVAWG